MTLLATAENGLREIWCEASPKDGEPACMVNVNGKSFVFYDDEGTLAIDLFLTGDSYTFE